MAMADAAQCAIADCRFEWVPDTILDIGYHKPAELAKAIHAFIAPIFEPVQLASCDLQTVIGRGNRPSLLQI